MRKITILLSLFSCVVFSQNPVLTSTDWELTLLSFNGSQVVPGSLNYLNQGDVILTFTDNGSGYDFNTDVCQSEAIGGNITYPINTSSLDEFRLLSSAQALGMCCDPNANIMMVDQDCLDLRNYSSDYFDFWNDTAAAYNIEVLNLGNTVVLRVTDLTGDFAEYNAVTASISDSVKNEVYLTQAFHSQMLTLHGLSEELSYTLQIFDLSGKLIKLELHEPDLIDVSSLIPAIYILRLYDGEQFMTLKFLKS